MTSKTFDADGWIDRVTTAVRALAQAQEPYLQAYWQHNPRKQIIVNGRDETPFPLDDVRMVYAEARYSRTFGREAEYAPLRAMLDPARHALLSHPKLERVAVAGRIVGENDFWMRMVNSGTSISAGDLIAGLMARAAELSGDGIRAAARELNAFLSPAGDGEAAEVLGNLDEGCDALLFYGVTVTERIGVEDGMEILPFGEVGRFVDQEMVEDLAPSGAGFHRWRSVGAVIRPFRWRPAFRRSGSVNEPIGSPPAPFFPGGGYLPGPAGREPCSAGAAAGDDIGLHRRVGGAPFGARATGAGRVPEEVAGGWHQRVRRVPGAATGGARRGTGGFREPPERALPEDGALRRAPVRSAWTEWAGCNTRQGGRRGDRARRYVRTAETKKTTQVGKEGGRLSRNRRG